MIFFLAVGILNFIGGCMAVLSWPFIRRKYRKKPVLKREEKVSVIIPCKGEIELESFENQEYRDFEIIVVVDNEMEKRKVEEKRKSDKVKVLISKKRESCSGKNSALLTGIEEAEGKILVFADADIKPHAKWLYYLVASLGNISTTYRWYFKNPLLCVWNSAIATILFYKKFNFAWGGSTAIRREVFEKLGIKKIWENEFVDDLTLTKIAKENGYEIEFVPQAIVESKEEKKIFQWMNKEMVWVRYYFSWLWKVAMFFNIGMRASNIAGLILLFFHPLIGFLLISPVFFDFIRGWQEYNTFKELMEYPKEKFLPSYYHILLRPLASFILSYNLLSSLFIKEIEWQGRTYVIQEVFHQRKSISKIESKEAEL